MANRDYFLDRSYFNHPVNRDFPDVAPTMIIVIPSYNELHLLHTLKSLDQCQGNSVCIIVVVNFPDNAKKEIKAKSNLLIEELKQYSSVSRHNIFFIAAFDLPSKIAGVGLARKIGMDEASFWYDRIYRSNGLIVALDADCTVSENYIEGIERHFDQNPKSNAASIYFEHPLIDLSEQNRNAIVDYELHLRLYIEYQRKLKLPYAYHTVGSSMSVRSASYIAMGGMNKRKAGEDFYFMHKFTHDQHFGEINDITVFPSSRVSDRVPFGTGKAVGILVNTQDSSQHTYNPISFLMIRSFFDSIGIGQNGKELIIDGAIIPGDIGSKLGLPETKKKLKEIQQNTSSRQSFEGRFYAWFNGFTLMKALHYLRDNSNDNLPVLKVANSLSKTTFDTNLDALSYFRNLQKHLDENFTISNNDYK